MHSQSEEALIEFILLNPHNTVLQDRFYLHLADDELRLKEVQ